MILTSLRLVHWRGYEKEELTFAPGLTVIRGRNGSGKTNLAEAIYFLSLARSWRTSDESLLIQGGQDSASLLAEVEEGQLHRKILIELGKGAKRVEINGKPCHRLSELSKVVNVVSFSPEDVSLFRGSPATRRSYLDIALSKQKPEYLALASRYAKLLRERNAELKSLAPDPSLLDVLTQQMVELEEPIVDYRRHYLDSLNKVLPDLLSRLAGEKTPCEVVYRPFVKEGEGFKERALKAYSETREADLARHTTSVGVHREDFSFRYREEDVGDFGSQGENRMASLATKLAPYLLIEEEGKKPIAVLDDVTSELDQPHVACLLDVLKGFSQVFLTATELEIEGASVIEVASNHATRRK